MFRRGALLTQVVVLVLLAAVLGACAAPATAPAAPAPAAQATAAPAATQAPAATEAPKATAAPAATEAPKATEAPAATEAPKATEPVTSTQTAAGKKFTIGVSNSFISSEYRTQMIQELKDVNAEYMKAGLTNDLVIESADTDVAGQIQQLQNLIDKKVDAILVNPGDVNGLNATLEDAISKGIVVLSVDQALQAKGVYDVGIDQYEWAKTSADWLAKKLDGKGSIVEIEGFPGHPANVLRMSAVDDVLKNYPDIKVLAKDTGKWDEATGQQVMSNFLASFPNMTGYWTQDGMAIGAMQALLAANPANPPVGVGEGRCQFLQLWDQKLKQDPKYETIAVANPPGVAATGLRIAVNMLQSKKVDESKLGGPGKNQFVVPIPVVVTKDNFQDVYSKACAGKPATYLLDGIMSDAEVQQYFAK